MVDTRDLKSLGHYGCVGSSPTSGTMSYQFITNGTCSRRIDFDFNPDGTIGNVSFVGGCHGNLKGIATLVRGMKPEDAIARLQGIDCRGKGTSCPDQFAKALKAALAERQAAE